MGYTSTDLPDATPYMNKLVRKGVKLTHYYAQPSCTPSRVTMMTGKFAYKTGYQNYEQQVHCAPPRCAPSLRRQRPRRCPGSPPASPGKRPLFPRAPPCLRSRT